MNTGGAQAAAGYFTAMMVSLTLGGAVAMQIKSLLDGKDLEDMTSPGFWFGPA